MKTALITIVVIVMGYYLLPIIGSFIAFAFKSFLLHFILDYGLYIIAFAGGGGYFWWKHLRKLN
jgi:hypothetical protein